MKKLEIMNKVVMLFFVLVSIFAVSFVVVSRVEASCLSSDSDCIETCPSGYVADDADCIYVVKKLSPLGCAPIDTGQRAIVEQMETDCVSLGSNYVCDNTNATTVYCYGGGASFSVWGQSAEQWCSCNVADDGDTGDTTTGCAEGTIPNPIDPECKGGKDTLGYLIGRFIPILPIVIGLVLLAMIVMGGIKIATAGDNEEQKKKGIQTIVNAGVGVGVVVGSVIIISILEAILKVQILYGFAV